MLENTMAHSAFGVYIETLYSTELFGNNKAKLGVNLFKAADSKKTPSEESIKAWISGRRHCRVISYFPSESVNSTKFIDYFKQKTRTLDSWKELQKAFSLLGSADLKTLDCCVDLETESSDIFFLSLLNQFQRIHQLPESAYDENRLTVTALQQTEVSLEQMRSAFLETIHKYRIMGIINRKPPILNRQDSVRLNVFLNIMDQLVMKCNQQSSPLYASIKSFVYALQSQVWSLDATLNNRFGFDDETASINMEDDDDLDEDDANLNRLNLPELSIELIAAADDPFNLLKIVAGEWGNFRSKMNVLFADISSWQDKT